MMDSSADSIKHAIDEMLVERKPVTAIVEFIGTRANGNMDSFLDYLHKRQGLLPEEYLTDAGNGEAFSEMWRNEARYCYEYGAWLVYEGGRWRRDSDGSTKRMAIKTVRSMYIESADITDGEMKKKKARWLIESESDRRLAAMLALARVQPGMTVPAQRLDDKPWLLNVKNGTINLKNGELQPHNPDDFLTQIIEVGYQPDTSSPEWDKFLLTIFNHDLELIDYIQRAVGYSLNGTQDERVFFFLYGKGANGKSQFTGALRRVLSDYAQEADPEVFMERRGANNGPDEARAALKGVRFLTATETKRGQNLDTGFIKRMTGGEPIWHERKYEHRFRFDPTHTLWLSGNHEPRIKDTTNSIWDRLKKIPFEVRITEDKQIKAYGEQLAAHHSEAILAWSIKGAMEYLARGLSDAPAIVTTATENYREHEDNLHEFLESGVREAPGTNVTLKEMYEAFRTFCDQSDSEILGKREFNDALRERGFQDKRGGGNKGMWVGVTLVKSVT